MNWWHVFQRKYHLMMRWLSQDIVTTIANVDLYRKNSKAVRDDANSFREFVYAVQDQVYSETETE